jgi:predicted CoA-binding protein
MEARGMTHDPEDDVVQTKDWRAHLLHTDAEVEELLRGVRRVAVLGMKTEEQADQPAYCVPLAVQERGYEVVPVPVYYPGVHQLLNQTVYRSLEAIPGEVDLVCVFRRPKDIPAHVDDILAKRPRAVWFQSGIRHEEVAERLARAGIDVVQDRCLMVDLAQFDLRRA